MISWAARCATSASIKVAAILLVTVASLSPAMAADLPHPPRLRPAHEPSSRKMGTGPARYVDVAGGNDQNSGEQAAPWKTIAHALARLRAGETLYLREGVYYENVYLSRVGSPESPITVRAYPGERVVIDGGYPEFYTSPAAAWEPVTDEGAAPGEYRSTRTYSNARDVVGAFGDSSIGLQTYWHVEDLRSDNEDWIAGPGGEDLKPVYCGPGIYLDRRTGRVHARLGHTRINIPGVANYTGETDPRKIPLVIAAFASVPLLLDQARHVRLHDLEIRGGGYNTLIIRQSQDIEFDNVTIRAGTYGVRTSNVVGLRFLRSAVYGGIPPWCFRNENSLNTHPPRRGTRDVARLTNHALWVFDAPEESSVYYVPFSRDWEIAYSEFTEGSDGLYLDAQNIRFHHNVVDNMLDDGMYLSPSLPRGNDQFRIYCNRFSRCLTALAFGTTVLPGEISIYRNIIDLTEPCLHQRPGPGMEHSLTGGTAFGDHGSPPWAPMRIYHNTIITREGRWGSGSLRATSTERPRHVFNNIFLYAGKPAAPAFPPPDHAVSIDGNVHWNVVPGQAGDPLARWRESPAFLQSKSAYPSGWESSSTYADPKLVPAGDEGESAVHESPAAHAAGVLLPAEWEDPFRPPPPDKPAAGALPAGMSDIPVGRQASPNNP